MGRKSTYMKLFTLIYYVACFVCVSECTLHAAQLAEVHSLDMQPERWASSVPQVSYNVVFPANRESYQAGEWKPVTQIKESEKRLGKQNVTFKPPQLYGLRIYSEHRTPFSWDVKSVDAILTDTFNEIAGKHFGRKQIKVYVVRKRTIGLVPRFMNLYAYNVDQGFNNLREDMLVNLRKVLQLPAVDGFTNVGHTLSVEICAVIEGAIKDLQFLMDTDSASISKLLRIQEVRTQELLSIYQNAIHYAEGTDGIFHQIIEFVDHALGRFVWSNGIEPPHFLMQLDRYNLDFHKKLSSGFLWFATVKYDSKLSEQAKEKLDKAVKVLSAHNPILSQLDDDVKTLTEVLTKAPLLRTSTISKFSLRDETSSRVAGLFGLLERQLWTTHFVDNDSVHFDKAQLQWRVYGQQLCTIFDELRVYVQ
ncbi:hypothetical protein DFH28DRAFT_1078913 [Melampsora americana]|nr:hypothetical protein DFH28DRAFT_1078913 [Melampsora americana]